MIRRNILFIFLALPIGLAAQDSLQLLNCYQLAIANSPIGKQKQLYTDAADAKIASVNTAYLPSLNLNAQATYQSDVTKMALDLSKINPNLSSPEGLSKDQYKATVDVSQLIYDGGLTPARREAERVTANALIKSTETELYQLRDRVNQLFFALLMVQENTKSLLLMQNELATRIKLLESGVKNGTVLSSTLNQVKADYLKVGQSIDELKTQSVNLFAALSELTGKPIAQGTAVAKPNFTVSTNISTERPERELFDLQKNSFEQNKSIIAAGNMPKLAAFGQLGYGKPGLNMLENQFKTFYIVGLKLSWNIFDWNQRKNDIKYLSIQQNLVDTRREAFDLNQRIASQNETQNMEKFKKLVATDKEILELRTSVLSVQRSRFENGTIDAADYLAAVNAETIARINIAMHEIQAIQAQANLLFINGKLNN